MRKIIAALQTSVDGFIEVLPAEPLKSGKVGLDLQHAVRRSAP